MEEPRRHQRSRKTSGSISPEQLIEDLQAAGHTGECPYGCPVCAAIGILKQMSPEVTQHLAAAAREFVLAAKAFLDGIAERDREPPSKVERIPLE